MVNIVKIKLGDKERILKFNQYCLINIATVLKCDPLQIAIPLNKLVQKNIIRALVILTWGALMGYNEEIADYDNDVELKDIAGWIQDADLDNFMPLWEAFKSASGISDVLAKQSETLEENDEKKKK